MGYTGPSGAPGEMPPCSLALASSCHLSKLARGASLTCDVGALVSAGFSHVYIFLHVKVLLIVVSQKNKRARCISEALTT